MKLSSVDQHALHRLQKHGELILAVGGKYYGRALAPLMIPAKQVEKLAAAGLCRIDRVGESTFAVPVSKEDAR